MLLHAFVIALLVTPFAVHSVIVARDQGAGGPGPAGGGGGGRRGTGGAEESEHLQFVVAPSSGVTPALPALVPPTPVPPPEPIKVVETPPTQVPAKVPITTLTKVPEVSLAAGVGGGTGRDGTAGNGPGTGGGVGTGVGSGRGTGVGPGTGGGNQENYPPKPKETLLPPIPVPSGLHGARIIAEFDVDSTGRVLGFDFTRTKDRDYDRRLEEQFRGFRFFAGARPDGTPIRMKAQVSYILP